MKTSGKFSLPFVTLALLWACNPDLPAAQSGVKLESGNQSGTALSGTPRDPSLASLKIVDASNKFPASAGSAALVPGINVTFTNADYFQLLRCKESTVLTTSTGTNARMYLASLKDYEKQDVWQRAEGECASIGKRIARDSFQDLTAGHTTEEQHFYYVLNPCVAESTDPRENCSYKIAFTEPMSYTSTFTAQFIQLGTTLNELESQLSSSFYQLSAIASATRVAIEKCEDDSFQQKLEAKKKAGLFNILSVGVKTLVGGLVGGPIGAFATSSGVLDGVLGFFKPKTPDTTFKCDAADKFKPMAIQLADKDIPELILQVKNARVKMNQVNDTYAKLDVQNIKDNN